MSHEVPNWLLEKAREIRQEEGSKGYWKLRSHALSNGIRPFDAMVAWQMAHGKDLDTAVKIAARIASRKR